MNKTALILGISGQDGAYLADFLLGKQYRVYGSSRDAQVNGFFNLKKLGIYEQISCVSVAVNDFRCLLQAIMKIQPDEIYNLSGQSSVGLSFEQPVETMESISLATLNLLEAIRFMGKPIRLYFAGSSECFGDTFEAADENTPFRPRSPYAVAKSASFWQVANYREAYHIHASTGILFNHDSPLRPDRFVIKKIIATALRIDQGSKDKLILGNMQIERDWGWAPDYVQAMWLMLQQPIPDDYIIATGTTHSLQEFVNTVFSCVGLDWREHVIIDKDLYRPLDLSVSKANPGKAWQKLGWRASHTMQDIVALMLRGL
ncbi:MAG: GDP-mannose 4,6-dehydratase [Methylococcaceae bacterium]